MGLYKLFKKHKPELLNEESKNLTFYDEVFRKLKSFCDFIL